MTVRTHPAFLAMRDERATLVDRFRAAELDGIGFCRELSDAMDRAIVSVWRSLEIPGHGVALVALGGYGRRLLAPQSDVDLMVLSDGSRDVDANVQPLFYALWDAGLKLGHAIRTPSESLKLAGENLEAETSFLDLRLLDGEVEIAATFEAEARAQTRKRGDGFIDDVRAMMHRRHATHGSATSQLEPNIKEGTGGIRDLHVLGWFAAVAGDLVERGLLDEPGRDELHRAHGLLLRVRGHLHLATGHANDVLLFHLQRSVAEALGYRDGDEIAEDQLMRDLFAATRAVESTVLSVAAELHGRDAKMRRDAPRAGPFVVVGERVLLDGALDLAARPEDAIGLFALGATPGAAAMRAVRVELGVMLQAVRNGERETALPLTAPVRDAFRDLLRRAPGSALEMADHAGVFAALFPEWDQVRYRPQRNIYHRYTVDAHLFHTAAHAAELLRGSDDPAIVEAAELLEPEDRDLLLLAALFHDVGKGTSEDHCVRGERLADALATRLDLPVETRTLLAWLVRNHLLLVDTATRRDLGDENLVVDIATKIGDSRRARLLYLLTVADGIGTGPTAWGPWKSDLVTELFQKVVHTIERGDLVSADVAARARDRRLAAERLAGPAADHVATHLDRMSRTYLLAFAPEELVTHAALAASLTGGEVRATGAHGKAGMADLTVVAKDRPGLFSKVSGVLALHGISIAAAQVYTRSDGIALEWFRCEGIRDVDPDPWPKVTADVERALRGRLSIESRVATKRETSLDRETRGKGDPPKVVCDLEASDFMTVVEVHTTDRVGLLYDITAALAECALDVHVAKIATYGDDVVDVFYVRDLDGQKIIDAEHLSEIERAVLHRLRGPTS